LPSISETLQNLVQVFEKLRIDYMLIGGYALPAYGLVRATVDIDIAIILRPIEPTHLEREITKAEFQVSSFSPETPCFIVTSTKTVAEFEVWTKPDGIVMDAECLRRRRKAKIGKHEYRIIGPEDFIVNKLSRRDRRIQDEADVLSVLTNDRLELDLTYLRSVAERAGVLPLLKALEKRAKQASPI